MVQLYKQFHNGFYKLLCVFYLITLSGCMVLKKENSAKEESNPLVKLQILSEYNKQEKYFIVCGDSLLFHLQDVAVNVEDKTIIGVIQPIDENHLKYFNKTKDQHRSDYKQSEKQYTQQCILKVSEQVVKMENGKATINVNGIKSIDTLSAKNKGTRLILPLALITVTGGLLLLNALYSFGGNHYF